MYLSPSVGCAHCEHDYTRIIRGKRYLADKLYEMFLYIMQDHSKLMQQTYNLHADQLTSWSVSPFVLDFLDLPDLEES